MTKETNEIANVKPTVTFAPVVREYQLTNCKEGIFDGVLKLGQYDAEFVLNLCRIIEDKCFNTKNNVVDIRLSVGHSIRLLKRSIEMDVAKRDKT